MTKNERLELLKKTLQIDKSARNVLQNQQCNERLQEIHQEQVDNITFFNDDYRNIEIPENAIIYCDIPYKQTEKYNASIEFDYDAFYDWCVDMKHKGYKVYISEYSMPEDRFECVLEMTKIQSLSSIKSSRVIEKLFTPK